MTTYIIVCVIMFGVSAAARLFWLALGGQESVTTRPTAAVDLVIGSAMAIWGLVLLLS